MAQPTDDLEAFIHGMPKAELHVHLEGCMTPTLVRKLAERNNISLPPGLSDLDQSGTNFAFHDLTSFLGLYYGNMTVLQTAEDFTDLAFDYLTRAAASNIVHCELFFDPQAHTSRGVPFPTIVTGYNNALQLAHQQYGISASLIMCILRDESANYGMATLLSSLPHRNLIAGVGLDSDERDHPPAEHARTFARARAEGYHLTAHCDIDQPNTLEHIRSALMDIGVDRLDHGTNIVDAPDLLQYVRDKGIGLTCCPISNSVVSPSAKFAEILGLLRQGVRVTINSDDPAYFRGYLFENLLKLARETDVTRRELIQLQRNAFNISWVSSRRRDAFLEKLTEYELKALGSMR